MNWAFRTGTVFGAIGLVSVMGVFGSGGFGPCGGSLLGIISLLSVVACVPAGTLFLVIGIFVELRKRAVAP